MLTAQQRPPIRDYMAGRLPLWFKNLAGLVGWLGFVAFALVVLWAERKRKPHYVRRRAVNVFLLFTLAVTFAAGVSRRELWPFSAWGMIPNVRTPEVGHARILGVDAAGTEHPIDFRAWSPLPLEELIAWIDLRFPLLSAQEKDSAARYLLERANNARANVSAGESMVGPHRLLGRLTAPEHMIHPYIWTAPSDVPSEPFVGIRVLREFWNVERGREDPDLIDRELIYEFPNELP